MRGGFQRDFSGLSSSQSTLISSNACSNTARNCSDWRISSSCSRANLSKEASMCPKYCQPRRRSSTRKLQGWRMPTQGSFTRTNQSAKRRWSAINANHSCTSKPRSWRTKMLIKTSTILWWFSALKSWRRPLTLLNWWSWRRKSTDFIEPMLLISQSARCTMNLWLGHSPSSENLSRKSLRVIC